MNKLKFNEWLEKYYNKKPYELNKIELDQKHKEFNNYLYPDDSSVYTGFPWLDDCSELIKTEAGGYIVKGGQLDKAEKAMEEWIEDTIKKEKDGYVVYSEKGKKLSKPYKTEEEAKKRLQQIEYFKHAGDSMNQISKSLLEDKIKKVLGDYLKSRGYEDSDIDDYVVIDIKEFVNEEGYKGIKIQIRNDLVGYYSLPDEVAKALDDIVDPEYFEPYSSHVWNAYIWDKTLKDSSPRFIYQFPSELTDDDIDAAEEFGLTYLGHVSDEGQGAGDVLIKGTKKQLEDFCSEYLDYQMNPDFLYEEDEFDTELITDAECKDTVIKNNDVYETLDKYLKWEGIIGYTDEIMEVWKTSWATIDDEYKEFNSPEEALEAYLEWEGIIGYTSTIIDILNGEDAFINTGKNGEIDATDDKGYNKETDFWHDSKYREYEIKKTDDGLYQVNLDGDMNEFESEEKAREAIDEYINPDIHKPKTKEIEEEKKYVVYADDEYRRKDKEHLYYRHRGPAKYSTEEKAELFTKSEAEKIEGYTGGEHTWKKKKVTDSKIKDEKVRTPRGEFDLVDMTEEELRQQGFGLHHIDGDIKVFTKNNRAVAIKTNDSVDLMELLNKCKDIIKQNHLEKDFEINHKKEGQQDKIILKGTIDFEDTESEDELIDKLTECIEEYYANSEFKYNDQSAGGSWLLKE